MDYWSSQFSRLQESARSELLTAEQRESASRRIQSWLSVRDGVASGSVRIGSRQPTAAPVWVTLEVVKGGFSTGNYAAALAPGDVGNDVWLSPDGLDRLGGMLVSGKYRCEHPENGALLVLVYLLRGGHDAEAKELLAIIKPWLGTLRFYPEVSNTPIDRSGRSSVQTVAGARARLGEIVEAGGNLRLRRNRARESAHLSVLSWLPLYRDVIELFLDSLEDREDIPRVQRDETGAFVFGGSRGRTYVLAGGWPCRRCPAGYMERAAGLLKREEEIRSRMPMENVCKLTRRRLRKGQPLLRLLAIARKCVEAGSFEPLTGREVGYVRLVLARFLSKHGHPWSESCLAEAKVQRGTLKPATAPFAKVVLQRLSQATDPDAGLDMPEVYLEPVSEEEASSVTNVDSDAALPALVCNTVQRCEMGSPHDLLSKGILSSATVLAEFLPSVCAPAADKFTEPDIISLYTELYRSFRRRRSLLLLNLEKQVALSELPWVRQMDVLCPSSATGSSEFALVVLLDVAYSMLHFFPDSMIPNEMVSLLSHYARTSAMSDRLPLVEQIAADIFMGVFSRKFDQAAVVAARLLQSSFYEAFFDLKATYAALLDESEEVSLLTLSEKRAGSSCHYYSLTATWNVLRKSYTITTHNLAQLFAALPLRERFGAEGILGLATSCTQVLAKMPPLDSHDDYRSQEHARRKRNTVIRHLVFFLSMLEVSELPMRVEGVAEQLSALPHYSELVDRLHKAVAIWTSNS